MTKTKLNISGHSTQGAQVVIETYEGGKQVVTTGELPMINLRGKKLPIRTERIEMSSSDTQKLAENPDVFELVKGKVEKHSRKRVG